MSDDKQKPTRGLSARALVLGVSLSTIAIAGSVMPASAQSDAEAACGSLFSLRSPFTIERVIERYAEDPCVPVMLANLPPNVLSRLDPAVVSALPPQQLRRIPQAVLDLIGIEGVAGTPQGTSRSIANPYGY